MKLLRRTFRIALLMAAFGGPGCQSNNQFAHRPAWFAPQHSTLEADRYPGEMSEAETPSSLAEESPRPVRSASPFKLVTYNAQVPQSVTGSPPDATPRGDQTSRKAADRTPTQAHQLTQGAAELSSHAEGAAGRSVVVSAAAMSLADFESLALTNNPTLRELAATTQKAAGYRTQVGLRPNPTVGYQAMQLADQSTDQHTAFVEQEFVRGDKLELNRRVQNEALRAQLLELESQRWRVITDVRSKFYQALAAQRRVELIRDFQSVTDHGLELAELRKKALEGSQIDVLQAKVQKNEIDLAYRQAQVTFDATLQQLTAVAGATYLTSATLVGELPRDVEPLDWSAVADQMISASPERQVALARVSQARAQLQRHSIQSIPNVTVQLAAGVDNGTDSGLINLEVGAPLPVFNQNQGNIAAARGEYCRAVMEVQRVENSIKARVAEVSQEFDAALAAVSSYGGEILPSAEQSLQLAELAYKSGETNFIQVLVARRTYFDSNLQYIQARGQLAQAQALVDGFVLTGGLDPIEDQSGDDSLRDLTFSQQ